MSEFRMYIASIIRKQMQACHFDELYLRFKDSGAESEIIISQGDEKNNIQEEHPLWLKNAKNVVVCYLGIRNELGL